MMKFFRKVFIKTINSTPDSSYRTILKTGLFFGFVRIFRIAIEIIRNKIIAVLLGLEGVGIISLFTNTLNLVQSAAGLGVSQSAIRNISEANGLNDQTKIDFFISITNKLVHYTAILGFLSTVILSPVLSLWTFGGWNYTWSYFFLSVAVFFNILSEGRSSVLKGVRSSKFVGMSSILGSLFGLLFVVPLYFIYGEKSIVPSLIIVAVTMCFFVGMYLKKIKYTKQVIKWNVFISESKKITTVGFALMLVGFLGVFFDLIISIYIRTVGDLDIVGLYSASSTIITGYFGVILSSMTADYYPRICTIVSSNNLINNELNKQIEISLIVMLPIAVFFVFFSPILINILYSNKFLDGIKYMDYAIIGTIITTCSNSMGIILLAKQAVRSFITCSIMNRLCFIPVYIFLYNKFGLTGLGVGYTLNIFSQLIMYGYINKKNYGISLSVKMIKLIFFVLTIVFFCLFSKKIFPLSIQSMLGGGMFFMSIIFSFFYLHKILNINLSIS